MQFDTNEAAASNRLYAPGDTALAMNLRQMQYDPAGNLTRDSYTGAGERNYDAENRITRAQGGANGGWQTYSYDGDGRRVKRNLDGTETWQVYGLSGELIAEYAQNAPNSAPQKEYGYRNGQLLITADAPTIGSGGGPSLTANAPGSVALSWTAISGASYYTVERKTAGGNYQTINTITGTTMSDNPIDL